MQSFPRTISRPRAKLEGHRQSFTIARPLCTMNILKPHSQISYSGGPQMIGSSIERLRLIWLLDPETWIVASEWG